MIARPEIRNLVMTTPPAEEPVSLARAKLHLRVDSDLTDEDSLIAALIIAAREKCETLTRRSFVERTYELRLDGFTLSGLAAAWWSGTIESMPGAYQGLVRLPKPPLIAVESVAYVDTAGQLVTLDPSAYLVDAGGVLPGSVGPAYGTAWPQARQQPGSARIAYRAGFGAALAVPESAKQAMLLLVGHWFRNRESVATTAMARVPDTVDALLAPLNWGSYG